MWIDDTAPEESGQYLTTLTSPEFKEKFVVITPYKVGKGWATQFDVLAWMPLPEAYRDR